MDFKKVTIEVGGNPYKGHTGAIPIYGYRVDMVIDSSLCEGSLGYVSSHEENNHCLVVFASHHPSLDTTYHESLHIAQALKAWITDSTTDTRLHREFIAYTAMYVQGEVRKLIRKINKERTIANKKKKTK